MKESLLQYLACPFCGAELSLNSTEHGGFFNADYVGRLLVKHERGVADHRKLIWTLLMFEMWLLAGN